jgi:hypothetical protein
MDTLFSPQGFRLFEPVPFISIVEIIRSDFLKEPIEAIRAIPTDQKEKRDQAKKELPQFVPALSQGNRTLDAGTVASGLFQFDIDLDLTEAQYAALKSTVSSLRFVYCAFFSPSKKLKFFVKTDFSLQDGSGVNQDRYKSGFRLVAGVISEFVAIDYDHMSNVISQCCAISYDPDIYFNPDCETLLINEFCHAESRSATLPHDDFDEDSVRDALRYIPRDLDYYGRLRINSAVFFALGQRGIAILEEHWTTNNRAQLSADLRYQSSHTRSYSAGKLFAEATINGWKKPPANKAKRKMKACPSDHKFPAMLAADAAKSEIDRHIADCLAGASKILRITCGLGKTELALRHVLELAKNKKILYLTPNHQLSEELSERFKSMKAACRSRSQLGPYSTVVRGKGQRCENAVLTAKYGGSPTYNACINECMYQGVCAYTEQFNDFSNVRFNWVGDYFHAQPIVWHGTRLDDVGNVTPREDGFTPDLIIMDESCVDFLVDKAVAGSTWISLSDVIGMTATGATLPDALRHHRTTILRDHNFLISSRKSPDHAPKPGDDLLLEFAAFLTKRVTDEELQKNVIATEKSLIFTKLKTVAPRYVGTPTIVLDATMDPMIAKAAFPDFEFVDISVKSSADFHVYQAQNVNLTKDFLKSAGNREKAIQSVQSIVASYLHDQKTIGVITHKSIDGFQCDSTFDKWVAEQIGATKHGYFGNLRGTNEFDDVDCLIIFGRHHIGNALYAKANALFGTRDNLKVRLKAVPIRMKDGTSKTLYMNVFDDPYIQAVYDHWCKSETIQAIGRGRPIHGKPKDVYLFSDESLGSDVEITDFFDFDHGDLTDKITFPDDLKFVQEVNRELKKLGFTDHYLKKNRDPIFDKFESEGFEFIRLTYHDTRESKKKKRNYFSRDHDALKASLHGRDFVIAAIDRDRNPVTIQAH